LAEDHIDVAAVVGASLHYVDGKAKQKGVRLASDVPPGLPALFGDTTRVRQILTNLVDNAVPRPRSPSRSNAPPRTPARRRGPDSYQSSVISRRLTDD